MPRYGMTIPFDGLPLHEQRSWFEELADLGYTDVWSSEAGGTDAFIPLALASAWAPSLRLGTAIVPAVARVVPEVGPGKEIVARIFVCPSDDTETVRSMGRFALAAYLNVGVYAAFHQWLGRGPLLEPMWKAWQAGDRKAATAAIPDEVVDDLIVHGSPEACRAHIQRYVANGVTTTALAILPFGIDTRQAVRDLAPAAG